MLQFSNTADKEQGVILTVGRERLTNFTNNSATAFIEDAIHISRLLGSALSAYIQEHVGDYKQALGVDSLCGLIEDKLIVALALLEEKQKFEKPGNVG